MDPNIRRLGYIGAIRATGLSLVLPYVALYLRNVLGIGFAQIGVLLALLGVVPVLVVPLGGLVTDRLGRRPLLLAALCVEAVAIVGTGAAMGLRSESGVIAAALTTSLAGTIGGPALSAYVADLATGSERTTGFTYLRIGWNVGFAVGVATGGLLLSVLGFARVGLLAGGILVLSTSVVAVLLDPSPYDRQRSEGQRARTGPSRPSRPLRESLSLIAGDRVFLALCFTVGIASLSVGQWATTFPLYVNAVLGVPYAVLGLGFALNGVLVVVGQAPTTRAAIGHRHTTLVGLGVALYLAGFLLLGLFALWPAVLLAGFFAVVFVLTMGENVLSIPVSTLPSNLAPPSETGAYNGAFAAIAGAGQVLAPTFGGAVLSAGLDPPLTWAVLMAPAVPALLVNRFWVARRILDRPNRA